MKLNKLYSLIITRLNKWVLKLHSQKLALDNLYSLISSILAVDLISYNNKNKNNNKNKTLQVVRSCCPPHPSRVFSFSLGVMSSSGFLYQIRRNVFQPKLLDFMVGKLTTGDAFMNKRLFGDISQFYENLLMNSINQTIKLGKYRGCENFPHRDPPCTINCYFMFVI